MESASSACKMTSFNDNDITVSMSKVSSARSNAAATGAVATNAATTGMDASPGIEAPASTHEFPGDDLATYRRAVRALGLHKLQRQRAFDNIMG